MSMNGLLNHHRLKLMIKVIGTSGEIKRIIGEHALVAQLGNIAKIETNTTSTHFLKSSLI